MENNKQVELSELLSGKAVHRLSNKNLFQRIKELFTSSEDNVSDMLNKHGDETSKQISTLAELLSEQDKRLPQLSNFTDQKPDDFNDEVPKPLTKAQELRRADEEEIAEREKFASGVELALEESAIIGTMNGNITTLLTGITEIKDNQDDEDDNSDLFASLFSVVTYGFGWIRKRITAFGGMVKTLLKKIPGVKAITGIIGAGITRLRTFTGDLIKKIPGLDAISGMVGKNIEKLKAFTGDLLSKIPGVKAITGIVGKGLDSVKKYTSDLVKPVLTAITGIKTFVRTSIDKLIALLPSPTKMFKSVKNSALSLFGKAKGLVTKTISKAKPILAGVASKAKPLLAKAGKAASNLVPKGVGKIAGKLIPKGVTNLLAKGGMKSLVKKVPVIGALAGLGFAIPRLVKGDITGAAMEVSSGVASIMPGAGTAASVGIDAALIARDIHISQEKSKANIDLPKASSKKIIANNEKSNSDSSVEEYINNTTNINHVTVPEKQADLYEISSL